MKIAIVAPSYNEESTIGQVIEDFNRQLPDAEIFVVNNLSTDSTYRVANDTYQKLQCHGKIINEYRQGKAFAVQRAFTDIDADCYVMVDADMTCPAECVHSLIKPIIEGKADMVIGDRRVKGCYQKECKEAFRCLGNNLVNTLVNALFGSKLNDILSGYRAFSHRFVKSFPILSSGFGIEAEMVVHALDKGFRVLEIPVAYNDRPNGSVSKLNVFSDGIRIARQILRSFKDYRPLCFYGLLALFLLLIGLSWYPTPMALIFLVLAALLLSVGLALDTIAANNRFFYSLNLLNTVPRQQAHNEKNDIL